MTDSRQVGMWPVPVWPVPTAGGRPWPALPVAGPSLESAAAGRHIRRDAAGLLSQQSGRLGAAAEPSTATGRPADRPGTEPPAEPPQPVSQ